MSSKHLLLFLVFLGIFSIAARLAPHPANFAPIGALALFAGYYGVRWSHWAPLFPLAAMFLSDLVIGFYDFKLMAAVYGSFLLVALLGVLMRGSKAITTVLLGSLTASVSFYLITNAAVWAFSPFYEKTFEGLMFSYALALPFFRNTLMGDMIYTGLFFGSYAAVTNYGALLFHKLKMRYA